MSKLSIEGLSKYYGAALGVQHIDLEVNDGELIALLGPSGCGKTTTLRMVAGFIAPSSGRIRIGGRDVTQLPPQSRDTAMVFQSYALFPHMTAAQNVSFGLEMRKVSAGERERRVRRALDMVRMGTFAERFPGQLSGGQQQRVALARALVVNPSVLLLDEPLSNLDAKLRADVRDEIRSLQQELGLTTLMVTHDQEEALAMADRLVVMEGGAVCQIGSAREIYERPVNAFVAGFVGRCNLVPGHIDTSGSFRAASGTLALPHTNPDGITGDCLLALRPEKLRLDPLGANGLPGSFIGATYLGSVMECHVDLEGTRVIAVLTNDGGFDHLRFARKGDAITLAWQPDSASLLRA